MLLNLLGNAAKFTNRGEISLGVERSEGDSLLFCVADTGPGMTPDQVRRLFEPFGEVHSRQEISGAGLGLAITQQLCELLGGRIEVDSRTGEGTRMTVSLPKIYRGQAEVSLR